MIFYFTGTGNSKFVAEKIAQKTGDRVINITDCIQSGNFSFELAAGESFGVVVPVYFYGIPIIADEFLQKLKISAGQDFYSYAVLNCGGATGNAQKFLKKRHSFNAVYGIFTTGNYVPLHKTESDQVLKKQLDEAEENIAAMAERIVKKEVGTFNPVRGSLPRFLTAVGYPMYKHGRKTKKFSVNSDCSGCGLCKNVCPRHIVEMENGKPAWTAPQCELCLACLHRCPTAAINYGKKSKMNGRYTNPRTNI